MKKVLVFVMTIVMLAAMAVPAFADTGRGDSPAAPTGPEQVYTNTNEEGGCTDCSMVSWGQRDQLPADKKANFEAAKECLQDAVPEGFACRLFVYHDVEDNCAACNIGLELNGTQVPEEDADVEWTRSSGEGVCSAYAVDMSMDGVTEVAAMQYVGGEWTECEVEVDGNCITVKDVQDAPMAVFMK